MKERRTILILALVVIAVLIAAVYLMGGGKGQKSGPPKGVANITWQWVDLVEKAPASQSVVPDPQNYTITFKDDGKVDIKADCNNVSGTYKWDKQGLKIELGPSTQAACGEQSLDQQFLDLLSQVVTGGLDGDRLYLETAGGAQRMGFNKGG